MPTLGGITYTELYDGSGKMEIAKESSAQRKLKCAWGDRLNLAKLLYGYTTIVSGAWVRYPGTPHPGQPLLYPMSIVIQGSGKPTGEDSFTFATLDIRYEIPPYDPKSTDPKDFISRRMRTSYEILIVDKYYETADPTATEPRKPNGEIQIVIPKVEYDLTLHHVGEFPFGKVVGFMGGSTPTDKPKLNSVPFEGAAAHHLLFLGSEADEEINSFGQKDLDVTYHFLWSPQDMRADYDPQTDSWLLSTHKITGNYKYDEADFNTLFYK